MIRIYKIYTKQNLDKTELFSGLLIVVILVTRVALYIATDAMFN